MIVKEANDPDLKARRMLPNYLATGIVVIGIIASIRITTGRMPGDPPGSRLIFLYSSIGVGAPLLMGLLAFLGSRKWRSLVTQSASASDVRQEYLKSGQLPLFLCETGGLIGIVLGVLSGSWIPLILGVGVGAGMTLWLRPPASL